MEAWRQWPLGRGKLFQQNRNKQRTYKASVKASHREDRFCYQAIALIDPQASTCFGRGQ
jgi:hypothetical protein